MDGSNWFESPVIFLIFISKKKPLAWFKERHAISFKANCREAKSVDYDSTSMNDWPQKLNTILQSYHPKDIYNADETAIFYKLMPEKT